MDVIYPNFNTEPLYNCPKCNARLHTDYVDNGFGPYSVQVSPYHCEPCNWVEGGCPAENCIKEQCFSWEVCRGRAIIDSTTSARDILRNAAPPSFL